MNKNNFFICIGIGKSGTTWLYRVLDIHPDTKMPPVKEINYFQLDSRIKKASIYDRFFSKHPQLIQRRKQSIKVIKKVKKKLKHLKLEGIKDLYWLFNFFFFNQNDKWYKKLFSSKKLSGAVSVNYPALSIEDIKRVKKLNPKTKIIIALRDPIDRRWSAIKMHLIKRKGRNSISEVPQKDVQEYINEVVPDFYDYTNLIKKWGGEFTENQILIYYYEELKGNPQKLYNKICRFLEIKPVETSIVNRAINKGIEEKIPEMYKQELVERLYPYIEKFAKSNPNKYSLAWLEKYKNSSY